MANITGRIFDLGRTALLASQQGINVTGHNISNVNTEGYSRQRLVLEATQPMDTAYGQVGNGVRTLAIERIHDRFLARQLNEASTEMGTYEASEKVLEQIEIVFNESRGFGLNESMENFWNAWQDLSDNPSGPTEREVLLGKSVTMARDFNFAYDQLDRLQAETRTLINQTVDEINHLAEVITDLNNEINRIESGGRQSANDLQDQRDVKLRELSELIDISTAQGDGGLLYVHAAHYPLVIGMTTPEPITAEDVEATIAGGKLKGYLEAFSEVEAYKEDVRLLAYSMRDQINSIHENGYDLSGQPADPAVNINAQYFFLPDAEVMEIGITDYNRVAAATSANAPGDNTNANAIYALRDQGMGPEVAGISVVGTGDLSTDFTNFTVKWDNAAQEWHIFRGDLANGDPYDAVVAPPIDQANFFKINFDIDGDGLRDKRVEFTLATPMNYDAIMAFDITGGNIVYKQDQKPHDFYSGLVAKIGNSVEDAERNKLQGEDKVTQLDNYREEISGVNMDEEMINLIQYQNSYQAAAKVIATVDEMIDTLMNMI